MRLRDHLLRSEPYLVRVIHDYFTKSTGNGLDWRGLGRHTPERVSRSDSRRRCHTRHTVTRYSRQDVIRILRLHARQLSAWERAGLIFSSEHYSFEALSQLRKLRDLQATTRISAK